MPSMYCELPNVDLPAHADTCADNNLKLKGVEITETHEDQTIDEYA